jgi:hypothetical protein
MSADARGAAISPPESRPRPGKAALVLLWDMAVPIALFYVLTAAGLSSFSALLLSAVLPGLSTLYQVARARHLDSLALFMVSVTVITAVASLFTGSPRFLLAKDGWVTGLCGLWLLATTWANPPVVMMFARPLLEGRIGPNGEPWSLLWERLPRFRRIWRVASIVWGVATILDGIVRFVIAYTLPINAVPALNGAQYIVLFVLLQIVTNIYYFRSGLYNPHSELYAPLHSASVPTSTPEQGPVASSNDQGPQLVVPGDTRGARNVSGIVDLHLHADPTD